MKNRLGLRHSFPSVNFCRFFFFFPFPVLIYDPQILEDVWQDFWELRDLFMEQVNKCQYSYAQGYALQLFPREESRGLFTRYGVILLEEIVRHSAVND